MAMTQIDNRKQISPERQALKDAIAGLAPTREEITTAQSVVERALASLSESRERLARFSNIDAEIPHQRLQVLKGGDPSRLEELKAMTRERVLAREEEAAALSVLDLANNELANGQKKLAAAESQVSVAAVQVLGAQISTVIEELIVVDQFREVLRTNLMSLGLPLVNGDWARLTADQRRNIVANAVSKAGLPNDPTESWQAIHNLIVLALSRTENAVRRAPDDTLVAKLAAEWQSFAAALLTDPAAEAGPSISPPAQ
jgi:hypothetical protein